MKTARAVIITAISKEFIEARRFLSDTRQIEHPNGNIYEQGTFSTESTRWQVLLVESGMGNVDTALNTQRAAEYFNPNVLLFVGIAGGLKDVSLGDVVAASVVYGFEKGKAAEKFQSRAQVNLGNFALIERAKAEARHIEHRWTRMLFTNTKEKPKAFVAPIAAGEKVLVSEKNETFRLLKAKFSDALAVEMEGLGFYEAAYFCGNNSIPALLVRGISDTLSDKSETEEEGWQEIAASHAAAFAFNLLSSIDLEKFPASKGSQGNSKETRIETTTDWRHELGEIKERVIRSKLSLSEAFLFVYGAAKSELSESESVWVRNELNGYTQEHITDKNGAVLKSFPEYRMPKGQLCNSNPIRGLEPVNFLPDPAGKEEIDFLVDHFSRRPIANSIKEIEQTLDTTGSTIEMALSSETEHQLKNAILDTQARLFGQSVAKLSRQLVNPVVVYNRATFSNILDNSRTRLLDLIDDLLGIGLTQEQKHLLMEARKHGRTIMLVCTLREEWVQIKNSPIGNKTDDKYVVALLSLEEEHACVTLEREVNRTKYFVLTMKGITIADSLLKAEE